MEQIWVFLVLSWKVAVVSCGKSCGNQYVKRESLCCTPTFNCPPGHEILPCIEEHGEEICQPCAEGYVQSDYISSLDDLESRKCFEKSAECTAFDLTHSKKREGCFPAHCKCNVYGCFYDDHCVCVKARRCRVNQTLDINTGECKPCPMFSYKMTVGCGPCIVDAEAWRAAQIGKKENQADQSQPTGEVTTMPNSKETQPRKKNKGCKKQRKLQKKIRRIERKIKKLERQKRRLEDKKSRKERKCRLRRTKKGKRRKFRKKSGGNKTILVLSGKN